MLKRLVGRVKKLARRGDLDSRKAATPVTDAVPDDWNDVTLPRARSKQASAAAGRPAASAPGQTASQHQVVFLGQEASIAVANGTTILDAALEAGVDLNNYCGGMCSCGSCRITIVEGEVSPRDDIEETTLELVRENEFDRLGCQTRILGDISVEIPPQDF